MKHVQLSLFQPQQINLGDKVKIVSSKGFFMGWNSITGYVDRIENNKYWVVFQGMYWERRLCSERELEVIDNNGNHTES